MFDQRDNESAAWAVSPSYIPWSSSRHLCLAVTQNQEMFRQGDLERAAGYAVSPLMDRNKTGITKSQVGIKA